MSLLHLFFAILVTASWGINFVFVKVGLGEMPPLLLCAIRFLLVSVPMVFFIEKPKAPLSQIFYYSLFVFVIQFSLLFMGMKAGMPAGLSSIIFQIQIFFSLFVAFFAFKETPSAVQIIGAIIAFAGIGIIWMGFNEETSSIGLILEIIAALSWSIGNIFAKKMRGVNSYSLVVWGCLLATPQLFCLSLIFEGPTLIIKTIENISWVGITSVAYIAYISTGVGYILWNFLLRKYPVSTVIPFTLLVPVFGLAGSAIVFDERLTSHEIIATCLIILGLAISICNYKSMKFFQKKSAVI